MIIAVIFDFDGLIFDTESFVLQAFEDLYKDCNVTFPREVWNQSIGSSRGFDPYEGLLDRNPNSREDLEKKVLDYFGIAPYEAIVFEDSPNGSLAAINANIPCVVIPNEVTRPLLLIEEFY